MRRSFSFALLAATVITQLPAQEPLTIRRTAKLVVVDVVVTGKDQKPVQGLKAEDFTVTDNKRPQVIRYFSESKSTSVIPVKNEPNPDPSVTTNLVTTAPVGALNVLVIDTMNTPVQAQLYLKSELLDFLAKSKSETPIAIFAINGKLDMLQGFTTDRKLLRAVLEKKARPNPSFFALSNFADSRSQNLSDGESSKNPDGSFNYAIFGMQDFEMLIQASQTSARVQYTLEAFADLARYLSAVPGRKNVIWYSGGFPLVLEPRMDGVEENKPERNKGAVRFNRQANFQPMIERTSRLLSDAQIALYPVSTKGLWTTGAAQADRPNMGEGRMEDNVRVDISAMIQESGDEQQNIFTMRDIAEETGGHAFFNTNGLREATDKVFAAGDDYYTLTYVPDGVESAETYHQIQVKLQQKGYDVRFRRGYYAEPPTRVQQGPSPTIIAAMRHGALPATQILFSARLGKPQIEADGTRKVAIDYLVDPTDIAFAHTQAGWNASLEFMVIVYANADKPAQSAGRVVPLHLTQQQYEAARSGGLRMQQTVSLPAKGKLSLRFGVYDHTSDRIGSSEMWLDASN